MEEAFAEVRMPGRFEVLGHQPLVIVDGAHNPPAADTCASVLFEDFDPVGKKILVVGFLAGREPEAMLEALRADEMDAVICCTPSTSRGIPAADVARAARAIGCDDVSYTDDVGDACDAALAAGRRRRPGAGHGLALRRRRRPPPPARPHPVGSLAGRYA